MCMNTTVQKPLETIFILLTHSGKIVICFHPEIFISLTLLEVLATPLTHSWPSFPSHFRPNLKLMSTTHHDMLWTLKFIPERVVRGHEIKYYFQGRDLYVFEIITPISEMV